MTTPQEPNAGPGGEPWPSPKPTPGDDLGLGGIIPGDEQPTHGHPSEGPPIPPGAPVTPPPATPTDAVIPQLRVLLASAAQDLKRIRTILASLEG